MKPVKTQWEIVLVCFLLPWFTEERVYSGLWLQKKSPSWQGGVAVSSKHGSWSSRLYHKHRAECCLEYVRLFTPKPAPLDGPYLPTVSNSTTKPGIKCSNAWHFGWHFLFKLPKWLIVSSKCLIKSHCTSFQPSSLFPKQHFLAVSYVVACIELPLSGIVYVYTPLCGTL